MENSYRELFERSPDAILIMEGDRFVDCNPAAVRMLRFPDKRALLERYSGETERGAQTAHPADLSPPRQPDGRDSREKAEEFLAITFERGTHTFEWEHLCADGEPLLVEVQLTVVRREGTPVLHVVWRDIRERRRLEAELRQAHRLEAVGRLAGGVAHDFNNLLVVILAHAELLEDEFEVGKPDREHVDGIRLAADRAAELTRQLLAFSRGQPAQSRPTDLGDLVTRLGGLLRRLIGEHIDLVLEPDAQVLTVVADPSQLEQLVLNLAANARDAMPEGGRLCISVAPHSVDARDPERDLPVGEYVELRVSDSGSGMTGEEQERAFDPFYTTKSNRGGTGLGLATVHAIAQQYDGRASITSARGRGTEIRVLLPRSEREPVALGAAPAQTRAADGGETILLVEDERAIRELFVRALSERGYRLITAADGQEALDLALDLEEPIDLLVTDVVMPRLSGPELVRSLAGHRPGLRVLFMSGYAADADLGSVSEDDRVSVLQKPFAPKQLQAEVRRMLDRG